MRRRYNDESNGGECTRRERPQYLSRFAYRKHSTWDICSAFYHTKGVGIRLARNHWPLRNPSTPRQVHFARPRAPGPSRHKLGSKRNRIRWLWRANRVVEVLISQACPRPAWRLLGALQADKGGSSSNIEIGAIIG